MFFFLQVYNRNLNVINIINIIIKSQLLIRIINTIVNSFLTNLYLKNCYKYYKYNCS